MSGLATLVASFTGRIERASVGSGAIPRNVSLWSSVKVFILSHLVQATYELATCVTFHCLSLTVTSVVIWPTALVTSGRTRSTSESTTESTSVPSTRDESSTASTYWPATKCIWATPLQTTISSLCVSYWMTRSSTYSKMTGLAASVATSAGTGSTYAQGRAVSLNMAKALAVVTLLRCCRLSTLPSTGLRGQNNRGARTLGRSWQRAPVRLMPWAAVRWLSGVRKLARVMVATHQVVCLELG